MKGPKGKRCVNVSKPNQSASARREAFKQSLKTKVSAPPTVRQAKRIRPEPSAHVKEDAEEVESEAPTSSASSTNASDGEDASSDAESTTSSEDKVTEDATPSASKSAKNASSNAMFVYDLSEADTLSSGKSFADCESLMPSLRRQLEFLKLEEMTHVQAAAIPQLVSSSKDALIRSETGSGKTLAFLVPAINNILRAEAAKRKSMIAAGIMKKDDTRSPVFARSDGTRVIIITPTRELAIQTVETAQKLTQAWPWMTTTALVSGTKRKSEKASLRKGVTILVTTPGRILDHLDTTNSFDSRRLSTLILDEVDRLLDLGFEAKLRRIISELKENMKTTKMMRKQIAALEAGEECEKLIVDKDMFEAQRQAQREIARALLRESGKPPAPQAITTPKVYDEDAVEPKSEAEKTPGRKLGTIIDMSEGEEDADEDPSPVVEKQQTTPRILNAADAAKFEADRDNFQVVLVSATLNKEVEKLARFCLSKDAVWLHGEGAKPAAPSTDPEEVAQEEGSEQDTNTWKVPKSLKQAYIKLTTPKQRVLVLMSLLMLRIPKKKRTIVFVNNCESVEFLHAFCEAVKWPNPPDSLKRKRPGDFDGRKEHAKIREKARQMLTEVDDVLFQMSEDEAETNVHNSKSGLFTTARVLDGLNAYRLHGSMSRDDRVGNLGDFNQCRDAAVIFATDVAARGLNMPEVDLVIHLDAPVEISDYIHRVGRTARMGTQGTSVLFLNEHETGYVKVLETAGACPKGIKESKEETLLAMWAPPTARTSRLTSFLPTELKKLRASDAQNFLMSRFTMFVEDDAALTDLAQKAYLSTVKTYRVYGETMRNHFDFEKLHLGHLAGSFFLRRSPNDIAASQQPRNDHAVSSPSRGRGDRARGSFTGTRGRESGRGAFRGSDNHAARGRGWRGAGGGATRGGRRGGNSSSSFREVRGGDRGGRGGARRGGSRGGGRGASRGRHGARE